MDAIEALKTRCSIRRFTDLELTDEQIQELLKVMVAAPSAGNSYTTAVPFASIAGMSSRRKNTRRKKRESARSKVATR